MSNKARRTATRLDYKVLHNSGQKVPKVTDSEIEKLASSFESINIMGSLDKLKASEKRISRDIDSCLKQNDLDEMFDIEMVDEYIQELTNNYRKYLDVHDDLHDALCADELKKLYPNHGEILDRLNSEIKKFKSAKYRLKQKNEEAKEEAREENLRKERKEELLARSERRKA